MSNELALKKWQHLKRFCSNDLHNEMDDSVVYILLQLARYHCIMVQTV